MGFLEGLTVLVLGLGDSGLAMARWCARCGARGVRVWDSREAPPQAAALAAAVPAATLLPPGALAPEAALDGVQLVLKSPGLAPHDARIAPLLALAAARGLRVANELGLFVEALAELEARRGYAPKILAITGTNGKTTTTAMTALLVGRAGRRVAMAGNIGPSMLTTLGEALDAEGEAASAEAPAEDVAGAAAVAGDTTAEAAVETPTPHAAADEAQGDAGADDAAADADTAAADADREAARADTAAASADDDAADASLETAPDLDAAPLPDDETPLPLPDAPPPAPVFAHLPEVWVLELSSFQLDGVEGFEPSAAAVLNLTQDHLDWHGTMAAYAAAKGRVYGRRAVMVGNRDDANVETLLRELLAPPLPAKGAKGKAPKAAPRRVVRFGLDAPRHGGDFGLVTENGMAWLVRAHESEEAPRRRRGADAAAAEDEPLHLQRLMPADALRLRGRHNAANAMAALALATAIGCPLAPMLHGLREYTGEPHRLEHVASVDGIDFFDDSKGTNVGASVAAIDGLGADRLPSRLVVLLGGDGKGQDFAPLAEPLRRYARAVATLGRDAAGIETALGALGLPLERHATLEAATRWAYAQARPGDAVLLSPACASLDMFRNYGHRGQVFVAEAKAIAAERGAIA